MLLLPELLNDWPCTIIGENFGQEVCGITEDSRNVKPGFVFVARRGKNDDGASFIAEAVERGAIAIVIDRPLPSSLSTSIPIITVLNCQRFLSYACARFAGNPSGKLTIIAVTGTNGKTTVTHFIGQLLKCMGIRAAVIGTTGVFIDGIQMEFNIPEMTTLPAEYFHPLLKKCEEEGMTHIVLEASSLGLSTNRLADCEIDVGILLNIGSDHYDEHAGKENYINAKKILLKDAKQVIVNMDDEVCVQMSKFSKGPCTFFGKNRLADVCIPQGKSLVCYGKDEGAFQLSMPGHFNRMNAAAAISTLLVLGFALNDILPHLSRLKLPAGRLQRIEREGVVVYVDFAHTPDAIEAVLRALASVCKGRLITVFGCGGNRDKGKRNEMGELAVFYSSSVIVTSDNPRNEDPLSIIADIVEGFGENCNAVEVEPDRRSAIRKAIFRAMPGDIVLIAGKGHEKIQHTAEGIFPFSDAEEAIRALFKKQMGGSQKLITNPFTER
ncbi:UDP-N-acetylmuramoyl-L-alanyl-D-glutamate--2,6-diaminopimelate ligase [Sporosarcina sp. G11-34]|uniref:UDP-N-acetylmuramoyl-L-alanyl-D-glutamate--2, 6-diaminopimelate ligase n=1 Tax=Sporosarcina sp. G11-34 TaxID=2849605 RepID=UPI0022A99E35|nr:UDP-N-acetylmuramoyl-L-alanyl-D-glutamate--2,6-diaminopimelate ligase [Sporosarcina sp. G11-34]MCZ2258898.1 UDP-N-acetylmuramoyl-L-alanyl-D-glutamate--2,6-diaminopimelate ligase [Sporosarcina sp. G11-34]